MKQSFLHLPSRGVYQAGSCNSSLLDCCQYVVTIRPSLLPVTCKSLLVLTQSCLTSPSYLLHTITEPLNIWKPVACGNLQFYLPALTPAFCNLSQEGLTCAITTSEAPLTPNKSKTINHCLRHELQLILCLLSNRVPICQFVMMVNSTTNCLQTTNKSNRNTLNLPDII